MNIDKLLFEKSLEIDFSESKIKVTTKSVAFFESIGLSAKLIDFFKQFSFLKSIDFDGVHFVCVNYIRKINLDEINKEIYKKGLLIIGDGKNGDPIVLNTGTMKVGYVFHDKLWPDNNFDTLESIYIDLELSIREFYYKAATEKGFPVDAYSAEEYMK